MSAFAPLVGAKRTSIASSIYEYTPSQGSPPQRDHRGACARADQGYDVVAHTRERIAAAGPGLMFCLIGGCDPITIARPVARGNGAGLDHQRQCRGADEFSPLP